MDLLGDTSTSTPPSRGRKPWWLGPCYNLRHCSSDRWPYPLEDDRTKVDSPESRIVLGERCCSRKEKSSMISGKS